MSMLRLAPLALLAASPAFAQEAPASVTATSPDGSLVLTVATDNDQRPTWSLSRKGQLLFAPSKLGFLLTDGIGLQRGFAIQGVERASADSRWEQPWGERRFVRDHHNELLVRLRQNESWGGHAMNVRFRLFDDGIGFRYELPEQAGLKTAKIADEITEFDLVPKGTAWWIAAGEWNRYEQIYQKTPVDAVATAHTPMTVRLDDGTHLSFHEAALVDYSEMWLKRAEGQKFRATLAPSSKGPRVVRDLPFATPWRTIRIAGSAAGLVESDLELNLNEPNKLGDVSWFKPMKYVGIWWGMIRGDWTWAEGPKHGIPRRSSWAASPSASAASGPTTTRSAAISLAKATSALTSVALMSLRNSPCCAMPGLPGAMTSREARGDWAIFQARACSRPPEPTSRMFITPE